MTEKRKRIVCCDTYRFLPEDGGARAEYNDEYDQWNHDGQSHGVRVPRVRGRLHTRDQRECRCNRPLHDYQQQKMN